MKKIIFISSVILGLLLLFGCYAKQYHILAGKYILDSSGVDAASVSPQIIIDTENRTFSFHVAYSSYYSHGTYELNDSVILASTHDKLYTYAFEIIDEAHISFILDQSSPIPSLSDGSLFRLESLPD